MDKIPNEYFESVFTQEKDIKDSEISVMHANMLGQASSRWALKFALYIARPAADWQGNRNGRCNILKEFFEDSLITLHTDTNNNSVRGQRLEAPPELFCRSLVSGGHLVSIHSKTNNDFVLNLVQNANITLHNVWLGSSDFYKDGVLLWTDGSQRDYHNWLLGKHILGLHCHAMKLNGDPGFWTDENCGTNRYPFICMYFIESD
ncbi:lectin-like [Chiloscyllium plagiosum]|uniref:lectin-like n=1 Tax=Chiloscyllium plagiosum TaxID=36176 RepID=UPI001CB7D485|nr:lectin-like [Chiloscyllium plagiosum]